MRRHKLFEGTSQTVLLLRDRNGRPCMLPMTNYVLKKLVKKLVSLCGERVREATACEDAPLERPVCRR